MAPPRTGIQLVFFDIGGVVVRADLERYLMMGVGLFGSVPEALRREVMDRVPELERGRIDSLQFWKEVGESLWRKGEGRPAPPEHCRFIWRDLMVNTAQVDVDVVGICKRLKFEGLRLGVISNTIEDHVPVLTGMGVYSMFDPCVLSCRLGHRKPEPEIYEAAARLAGLDPEQCLLVDDLAGNISGARRAGMPGVLFTSAQELVRDLSRLKLLS